MRGASFVLVACTLLTNSAFAQQLQVVPPMVPVQAQNQGWVAVQQPQAYVQPQMTYAAPQQVVGQTQAVVPQQVPQQAQPYHSPDVYHYHLHEWRQQNYQPQYQSYPQNYQYYQPPQQYYQPTYQTNCNYNGWYYNYCTGCWQREYNGYQSSWRW